MFEKRFIIIGLMTCLPFNFSGINVPNFNLNHQIYQNHINLAPAIILLTPSHENEDLDPPIIVT